MVVQFFILIIMAAEPIKVFGGGGEIPAELGGALVRKVPAAVWEMWEGDF